MFVDIHDLEMRVRDVYIDGNWQFNSLYTNLPQAIKAKLNSSTISLNPYVNDCYTWKGNLNGIYTARDGYYWLNRNSFSANATSVVSWSWLWHLPAPEKLKFFLWTMLHNSLPTREMLSHRGIINDNLCPRCNIHAETTLHCLRDCNFVKTIWNSIGFSDQDFFQGDDSYNCNIIHHETPTSKLVKWNALGGTGMILNVDGSSSNPGISGFGGLIHNADGAWVHGFFGNLGVTNILHAELMAIYKGLLLAWELNIKDLWCYSDSEMAIKLITEPVDV
ncbi:RNA-directed DNA polymerase (Reverse transcriptase) [Trifolium medium]|uniref:RNA-directed DNA polymerase (Reverse transcriptase) n=1 Tax=Trifolium medium TaxID=97028 RepID=A0A392LZE2_9FABA|nr:RNA-directed DNA polymerase (Reverse transcriptase) [Trifolium medium]